MLNQEILEKIYEDSNNKDAKVSETDVMLIHDLYLKKYYFKESEYVRILKTLHEIDSKIYEQTAIIAKTMFPEISKKLDSDMKSFVDSIKLYRSPFDVYNKIFLNLFRYGYINDDFIGDPNHLLVLAAENGLFNAVRYLVEEKNAWVNFDDAEALKAAYLKGHYDIVKYLMKHGSNRAESFGDVMGNFDLVRYLVEECNAKIDGSVMIKAARYADLKTFKYLVEKGGNIKEDGGYLLDAAIFTKNTKVLEFILESGVDPNLTTVSLKYLRGAELELLLEYGLNLEFEDVVKLYEKGIDSYSLLLNSVKNGNLKAVKFLVDNRVCDEFLCYTHVVRAIDENKNEIAKYMLDNANLTKHFASFSENSGNNLEMLKYFVERGYHPGNGTLILIDDFEIFKFLVENGSKVDETTLNYQASSGHLDIVKYLVEEKEIKSNEALVGASANGHYDVVKYLINHVTEIEEDAIKYAKTEEIKELLQNA